MKKFNIAILSIFLGLNLVQLQAIAPAFNQNSSLNQFGISTIIPDDNLSSDQYADVIHERIANEFPAHFTLQDIFTFLDKIQAYYDFLLNTQNNDPMAMKVARLALIDVKKAKMSPTIKANTVTPEQEHDLRVALGKLERQINPNR